MILDSAAGQVHQLNRTAADIWQRCDGDHTIADIAAGLAAFYDAGADVLLHDVARTIDNFEQKGLLEPARTRRRGHHA